MLSPTGFFHQNSLTVACCTFSRFKIRILIPNRFRSQTNDIFKLLGHNCNYQQGHLKQKVVALYCCGFNLKLLNGHSTPPNGAKFLRLGHDPSSYANLLQYIRYDNPENFSLISCTDQQKLLFKVSHDRLKTPKLGVQSKSMILRASYFWKYQS